VKRRHELLNYALNNCGMLSNAPNHSTSIIPPPDRLYEATADITVNALV
jgi:hypothetical protein